MIKPIEKKGGKNAMGVNAFFFYRLWPIKYWIMHFQKFLRVNFNLPSFYAK
jgi:hypothetical protein